MKTIFDKDFENEVIKSEKKVFLEFFASWCSPCKILEPVVEKIEKQFENEFTFLKMDIELNPTSTEQKGVIALPTCIIFNKGVELERFIGLKNKNDLENIIKKYLTINDKG